MNGQHFIDRAEFDTAVAGGVISLDQHSDLDKFIQTELMQVIDEVFDEVFDDIERKSVISASALRLEKLEINLGEINFDDYRQQMPQRLRQQLWKALDNARYAAPARLSYKSSEAEDGSTESSLFYFLHHGYLPWYASLADADALEALLLRVLETRPAQLQQFFKQATQRDDMLARMSAQFSARVVDRVMQLLESPDAADLDEPGKKSDATLLIKEQQAQFAAALTAGAQAEFERIWQRLVQDDPETLAKILRNIGQQAIKRKQLVQRLSVRQFADVDRLLEELARFDGIPGTQRDDDDMFARLSAQYSARMVDQVMQLLESPDAADLDEPAKKSDATLLIKEQQTQFAVALTTGAQAEFERIWQRLVQDDPETLAKILHNIGQQAIIRKELVQRLSARQFAKLVQLLEPVAHEILLSVLGHWSILPISEAAADPESGKTLLREYLLGYLMLERGARFSQDAFVDSLLHQIGVANNGYQHELINGLKELARYDGISGELARLALEQLKVSARHPTYRWSDVYRRYRRVEAVFIPAAERLGEALVLADIDVLVKQAPWLLLRLLRELQMGGDNWRYTLHDLNAPVLEQLGYAFLSLINQTVASTTSAGTAELVASIRRHVEHARSPQAFYAEILVRLIRGNVIDFDAIGKAEPVGQSEDQSIDDPAIIDRFEESAIGRDDAIESLSRMGPRAEQLLQTAELLTTASLVTGLALSPQRLQAVKWRFIKTYVSETGYLFNLGQFVRRYVDKLIDEAGIRDTHEFYSLLGQALLQNSLPTTRESTQQIIEVLDGLASEALPVPAEAAYPDQLFDDAAPDEDIHIENAGLVLLAPWLPRLFDQLGFIEDGEFTDRDAAERALHCLQYLVDASVSSPEYQLVLNKLLCGVKPGKPIRRGIELTDNESEQLESLLQAVTQHWKALENTSIDGLRESFLQRGGRLQRKQDAWRLTVEARAFDMLLDQVPWSYSTIKFGWMDRVIYVDWR